MKRMGLVLFAMVLFLQPDTVMGQLNNQKPQALQNVGVDEHLGEKIPTGLRFATHTGDSVTIAELMEGEKAVLLNPVYYECPQLCTMVIDAVLKGVGEVKWNPGEEYVILTFSIDPGETHDQAAETRNRILKKFDRPSAEEGWHFLTGGPEAVRALTEAVGFRYEKLERNGQFAHSAAIMFASPAGELTRYLYGIQFEEFEIRNALYEAADGEIGSTMDRVLLSCYQYDPDSQSYVPVAWRVMRLGGFVTLLFLGIFLGLLWLRDKKSNHEKNSIESDASA